jgi:hypothetical protein
VPKREDDLEILDADILRIMRALEKPGLLIEARAPLKLELCILIQMRLDIGDQKPKLDPI